MILNKTQNLKIFYLIQGLIVGSLLLILFWIFESFSRDISISFKSLIYLHKTIPSLWIIDLMPLYTGAIAYLIITLHINKEKDLSNKLNSELEKTEAVSYYINELINDNPEVEYKLQDDDDYLGKLLINLQENIKNKHIETIQRQKEDDQRNWISEGLAKFGEILRKDNDNLENFSNNILIELIKYLKINQGGFFLTEQDSQDQQIFRLTASYAYDRKKFCNKIIKRGEGLLGTCALERKTISLRNIPDNYVTVTSGIGLDTPKSLLIVPLIYKENIYGIIEIASFSHFEPYQIEFVEKIADSTASTLAGINTNIQTSRLLKESQEQAETLALQEEQMRQNMEELKTTQEEAARQSEKFISFTNSVNHTLIRAEYLTDGTLIYANTKFLSKLGYSSNSEVEGKHISIFINKKDREWFDPIWESLSKGGKHFEGYMKHVTKQGLDLWTMSTYTCIRKEDNVVEKILFLAIDTTEQKMQSLDYEGQITALDASSIKVEILPEGKIQSYNKLFYEPLGYTEKELIGKKIFDLLAREDIDSFKTIWKDIVYGKPHMGNIQIVDKNNQIKWLRGNFSAVRDMYYDIAKVIFIASDVTKEKIMEIESARQNEQLKLQEEKLKLAQEELTKKLDATREEMRLQFKEIEKNKIRNELTLEGALDSIITINEVGTIEFFNNAAEELFGIEKKDAIGNNVSMLFSEDSIANDSFVAKYVDPCGEKLVGVRKEINIRNSSGEEKPVLILLSDAVVDNQHTYTAFLQNIEVELF